jgi:hypothetical protein
MILLDYSQVVISNLMAHIGTKQQTELNEDVVRHMVLNSLRKYNFTYGKKYGDVVICCDDTNYWRKDFFPLYKSHRKKDREDSVHDWNAIFEIVNNLKQELRDHMPYIVLQISRAEADDIIGSLCEEFGSYTKTDLEPILIISGDKDFTQLQKYANVYQFSPMTKKFMTTDNPERFLREHIILGDTGDGIPNIFSDDDALVNPDKRQKPVSRAMIPTWIEQKTHNNHNKDHQHTMRMYQHMHYNHVAHNMHRQHSTQNKRSRNNNHHDAD